MIQHHGYKLTPCPMGWAVQSPDGTVIAVGMRSLGAAMKVADRHEKQRVSWPAIAAALRAAQDEGLETAAKVADEEFAKRFARGESGDLDAEIQHHKAITANTIAAAIRSKKSKGGE